MIVIKTMRMDENVFKKFTEIRLKEGRMAGKMFEIMVLEYERIYKAVNEQIEKKDGKE